MPILTTHGARVSYSRTGTGDAVLLIQGVGAIGNAWRPQVEALSQHYSVITFDTFFTGLRTRIGTRAMRRKAFLSLVLSKAGMDNAARPALEATMTELFARDLAHQPPIIMRQLRAMARYDAMWRLRCLGSIRTLVMSAGQDRIAKPEYGRALAAVIPGAAYVEVAHAGHAVPIETPWIINRLLKEHMRDATRRVAS